MPPQTVQFGKYELLERVNIGGMAEVWKARLSGVEGFEKILAVKRILPNIAEDSEFVSMFIDEAKIAVQLTHANIAQIQDLGKIDDSYFIAMEYVPGRDLRALFDRARKKRQHVPVLLAGYCIARVCDALDYAHRKKDAQGRDLRIVHRDVSPQNILVSYEGEVKLVDFGIAKAANKAQQTQAGILKGKFAYMSPEQVRGAPLDGRSDVFALGTVFYELLTGERLFPGDSDFSTLENVRNMKILPPSTYNNRIPGDLEPIVFKALERDLDRRYRTAADFGADLQRFLATQPKVFGPSDLADYMRATFTEEMAKEKQKAQELAAAQSLVARRTPASGMRASGTFPSVRASGSGANRVSVGSSGVRPPLPVVRASGSAPMARSSPTGPGSRSGPSGAFASPLEEPPPTVPSTRPLPPRAVVPPPLAALPAASPAESAAPRSGIPAWLASIVAAVAGAAVVVAAVLAVVAFRSRPGQMVVEAPPGAAVTVDGIVRGSGTVTVKVPPGLHAVRVEAPGFQAHDEAREVPAGGSTTVVAKLAKSASGSSKEKR